jgi:hypothetical protein
MVDAFACSSASTFDSARRRAERNPRPFLQNESAFSRLRMTPAVALPSYLEGGKAGRQEDGKAGRISRKARRISRKAGRQEGYQGRQEEYQGRQEGRRGSKEGKTGIKEGRGSLRKGGRKGGRRNIKEGTKEGRKDIKE